MNRKKLIVVIVSVIVFIFVLMGMLAFLENGYKISLIENIKEAINRQPEGMNADATVVDVTGLVIGEETEHEHVYKTMYDETNHWDQCIVCSEKRNERVHSITTTWAMGSESCYRHNSYTKTCSCGYSETGHKPCVWDGKGYYWTSSNSHLRYCSSCKSGIFYSYWLNGKLYEDNKFNTQYQNPEYSEAERCYLSDGRVIDCSVSGTCVKCGHNYSGGAHYLFVNTSTNRIFCSVCKLEFGTYTEKVTVVDPTGPATYRVEGSFKLQGNAWLADRNGIVPGGTSVWASQYNWVNYVDSTWQNFTTIAEMKFNNEYKDPYSCWIYTYLNIGGVKCEFGTMLKPPHIFNPDLIEPTIDSISVSQEDSSDMWSKNKTVLISGTENYTHAINMEILDDNEKVIYKGGVNNDWSGWTSSTPYGKYSFSCVLEVEAGLEGRHFKARVSDGCGNTTEKEFTMSKVDSVAPEVTSADIVSNGWAKSKDITFTATDKGIGNVQIAFNNVSDYKLAIKDGIEYLREYKLIGDVYSQREANVYYKDELGNISTKKVIIDKLDNTAPTIVGGSISNNKLSITAHDRHKTEGEGSGVCKYRFITSAEKLESPEITGENSTEVLVNENMTIPDIYNVKYVYVVAEDLVRKCE